nr:MAG TPA: hypothetical protein [Caudoviricetes sp.]
MRLFSLYPPFRTVATHAAAICCVFRKELEKYFYARKKHKRKGCIAFLCFIICTCYMM